MPIGMGIIGIVVSILFFFIALILYDAIQQNVVTCSQFTKYYNETAGTIRDANMTNACNAGITYANIAFVIAPIGILLDVFGILPIFGGRFSMRG